MNPKVKKLIFIILVIIFLKLFMNYSINGLVLKKYKEDVFQTKNAEFLTKICLTQKYVTYYNLGNIEYSNRKL